MLHRKFLSPSWTQATANKACEDGSTPLRLAMWVRKNSWNVSGFHITGMEMFIPATASYGHLNYLFCLQPRS
jgi:hypothetical protein